LQINSINARILSMSFFLFQGVTGEPIDKI
jgi:hypothetical protein